MKRLKQSGNASPGWVLSAPAFLWWSFFFLLPVLAIVYFSLADKGGYAAEQAVLFNDLDLDNYANSLTGPFFAVFLITMRTAIVGTLTALLVGFPVAYTVATAVRRKWQPVLLFLLILPFWTSFLLRTFAWRIILAPEGPLSMFLQTVGVLSSPLGILDTQAAVQLGIIYNYLPLSVFPIYAALDRIDPRTREASIDLGAGRIRTFIEITLPLAAPGIAGAAMLIFVLAAGDYVNPAILGGAQGLLVGQLIAIQILASQNLPLGAAMAVVLIALLGMVALTVWLLVLAVKRAMKWVWDPGVHADRKVLTERGSHA